MKLLEKGIPTGLVKQLYYINTVAVKLKPPYLLNEFEHMMKKLLPHGNPDEVIKAPKPMSYMYRVRGVPQGAPTSPLLATLALEKSILDRPNLGSKMYADDGLYYGDFRKLDYSPVVPNSGITSANIHFNLSKSGFVKKDGIWLKPLKFLGLTYDGNLDKLSASTRKGSTLLYDKEDLVKAYQERDSETKLNYVPEGMNNWDNLIESKLAGFIQSRLYTGAWNLEEFYQDFALNFIPESYCDKYGSKQRETIFTVFNVTSFAST